MPDNEPERIYVPLGVFCACLHAYHALDHLTTDDEAEILHSLIDAYVSRQTVFPEALDTAQNIIAKVWQLS